VSGCASPHGLSAALPPADTWVPSSRGPPLRLNKTKAGAAQRSAGGEAGAELTQSRSLSHAAPLHLVRRRDGATGPGSREARLARWPSYPAAALARGRKRHCLRRRAEALLPDPARPGI
jgi:hypothetical protein